MSIEDGRTLKNRLELFESCTAYLENLTSSRSKDLLKTPKKSLRIEKTGWLARGPIRFGKEEYRGVKASAHSSTSL